MAATRRRQSSSVKDPGIAQAYLQFGRRGRLRGKPIRYALAPMTGAATRPFHRGRFEDLPALPRVPHVYFEAATQTVAVRSAPFGDIGFHVATYGEGPPLLLLHGLMTSGYSWRYLMKPLGDHFRLIIPDLPGAGRSDAAPACKHSGTALATLVREFQEQFGISGCAAVGNSLGGYVCMLAALQNPKAFSRLIVIHPPGVPQFRLNAMQLALSTPGVRAGLSRVIAHDPLRWAHRNVHYYDETLKSLEEAREYARPLGTNDGRADFVRYLKDSIHPREIARFVFELRHRRDAGLPFPVPLQMIYARRDPLVDPRIGARLHDLVPDSRLEWIEDSSHFAHVDTPDQVAKLILEFADSE
jgi:pimeloyl-ACP methyl ester carboxylesterase